MTPLKNKALSLSILSLVLLVPNLGLSQTSKTTPSSPAPASGPTPVTLSEVDQLKIENSFLKANAALQAAQSAQQASNESGQDAIKLIGEMETKYHAKFDTKTGKFYPVK